MPPIDSYCSELLSFITDSPSPWHAGEATERRLVAAGYSCFDEGSDGWDLPPGTRGWVVRSGSSIVAFQVGTKPPSETGFRIISAHLDSPCLRITPRPDRQGHGYASLGVDIYGAPILATWVDRDLGFSGRVTLRAESDPLALETVLLRVDRPMCRIPALAIHLHRKVNEEGLKLHKQNHLPPVWGLGSGGSAFEEGHFRDFIADELGVDSDRVLSWEMCLHDTQPPAVSGREGEFLHAPRIDNLACSNAALVSLIEHGEHEVESTAVIALFDHEEIGSETNRGAASAFIGDVLTRLAGVNRTDLSRAISHSVAMSADMAHAVHPHYPEKHDGEHVPVLGGGPVLKQHSSWRYATDSETSAIVRALCDAEGIPLQEYLCRRDMRCGTTVGPILAAELGVKSVEIGAAMLSMHSIREMTSSLDYKHLISLMGGFLRW
jgi:aspartyl aminopeptidase